MSNTGTLAAFIISAREKRNLSTQELAKRANVSIDTIEKIESGQELFLSSSIRQRVAKVLNVDFRQIKALEKQETNDKANIQEYIEDLKLRILEGSLKGNICPICKSELICRVATMHDLENNPVRHPKARCSKCPFQIS